MNNKSLHDLNGGPLCLVDEECLVMNDALCELVNHGTVHNWRLASPGIATGNPSCRARGYNPGYESLGAAQPL